MRISLLALLLAASASAQSTVVFGNMGADGSGGFGGGGTYVGGSNISAVGFNTGGTSTPYLESITIGSFIQATSNYTLSLWTGSTTQPISLAHTSAALSLLDGTESKVTFTFNVLLSQNTVYWVTASVGQAWANSESINAVMQNDSEYEFVGNIYSSNSGSTWVNYTPHSISIIASVAPIPEPSTYGLILGGLALAGAVIRRRQKAAK